MNKQEFKVGDIITNGQYGYVVTYVHNDGSYTLVTADENGCMYKHNRAMGWRLKNSNKIHPHHDIIIAWLNGSDIQYYCEYDGWKDYYSVEDCVSGERGVPSFMGDTQIRIKPKQSERNLEIERLEKIINDAKDSIEKLKEMK